MYYVNYEKKNFYECLTEIVYCVERAESELFQSRGTFAASAASEGRIFPKTEIAFPHEPHILFLSRLCVHRSRQWYCRDLCNNQTIILISYFMKKMISFYLFKRRMRGGYNTNIRC